MAENKKTLLFSVLGVILLLVVVIELLVSGVFAKLNAANETPTTATTKIATPNTDNNTFLELFSSIILFNLLYNNNIILF